MRSTLSNHKKQGFPPSPDKRLFGYSDETANQRFYRRMSFIRRFEQNLLSLFEEGVLNGTTHACIGQEANCVGIMEHLLPDDHVFSNHRCHGHYLARTGDAAGLLAEIMGKNAGLCAGLGGSQHICAKNFKSNGVQGGIVPAAAGIALAEKLRASDNISIVCIGDGTLGEGIVYETLNMASLWSLPLLIVLENNGWAQSTPVRLNLTGRIHDRFTAFAIQTHEMSSTDVLEIASQAKIEINAVRNDKKPRVLVIETYRFCHHSKNDDFRPRDEIERHRKNDPLAVHGQRLEPAVRTAIEGDVESALSEIILQMRGLP
jgi:acetoin:2,6-dichlorophenolindophenol oxidoreductase subunit alpha